MSNVHSIHFLNFEFSSRHLKMQQPIILTMQNASEKKYLFAIPPQNK